MKRLLFVFFFPLAASTATAATPKPLEEFRAETISQISACQIKEKAVIRRKSLLEEEIIEEITGCISSGKASAKKKFQPALSTLAKKPAAAKLLKDYFASWMTAIEGVMPGQDERPSDYAQRQVTTESRYNETWNRLEIEAGF